MKEAFVAALLVIVAKSDEERVWRYRRDPLSENILWKEIKRQVENLRKEIEDESEESSLDMRSGMWPSLSSILRDEVGTRPLDIQGPWQMQRPDGLLPQRPTDDDSASMERLHLRSIRNKRDYDAPSYIS